MDEALCWRIEDGSFNFYPSARNLLLDGWLLRSSGGGIRRTNAVTPLRGPRRSPEAAIAEAEAIFERLQGEPIFRVVSMADEMDAVLAARGYRIDGASIALTADLDSAEPIFSTANLMTAPSPDWLAARQRIQNSDEPAMAIFRAMVGAIAVPAAFASISSGGRIVAQAFAGLDRGMVTLEAVATDPDYRKAGFARQVVGSLLDWGRTNGAHRAALHVQADNGPARALYTSLGFRREVYRYHYRRRIPAGE